MTGKRDVVIDIGGLIAPTLTHAYQEHKLYLLAWIVRFGSGPEKTIDVGIYNEPSPTAPVSRPGETYRVALLADATGRDYEDAAGKLYHAVDTHPNLKHWVPRMPRFRKDRLAASVKQTG